jgi:hypothetical protein
VADESADSQIPQIMALLGEMEDIRSYARLITTSPAQARAMVADGSAAAALIFPLGFLDSVYRGENYPPLLVLDSTRPLEVFGLSLLAENAGSMLSSAQAGVYFTVAVYDYVRPGEPGFDRMIRDINLSYAFWFLARGEMYRPVIVSPTGGALTIAQHYLLSALLFFCFIAPSGILYPLYSRRRQSLWLDRLRGAGKPLSAYAAAQILWGAVAVFLLLGLVLAGLAVGGAGLSRAYDAAMSADAGIGASVVGSPVALLLSGLAPRLSLSLLPGLLLIAVFIAIFTFACCNTGHIFSAVGVSFVAAGVFLTVSGGLAPPVLLPAGINALSSYSPLSWMRCLLSVLYLPESGQALTAPGIRLGGAALLLLAASLVMYSRPEGRRKESP